MVFLIIIIGFVVLILYNDISANDIVETLNISNTLVSIDTDISNQNVQGNTTTLNSEISTSTTPSSSTNNNGNDTDGKFYYNQLDETSKIIYNGFQENKEKMKSGTYTIQYGEQFTDILEQDGGDEILGDAYQSAIDAYVHDNVDLFYLDVSKMYITIETTKKFLGTKYNVYVGPKSDETYYNENFSSQAEVNVAIAQVETVKNNILSQLTDDDYKDIKIIHDYLVDSIEYDQNYESRDSYSIYGAFIDKKVVCEGYAKAFKYLANAAGIECELVQGVATNSEGVTESHEWNAVYLDGKWYYIDVTWDDPIIVGNGITLASYHYKYFLKGSSFFDKDHVAKTQFVDGGKEFYYPQMSYYDYD
jgi:hypothetical protein